MTRECGEREAGGLYLVCSLAPWGRPWCNFILCPPVEPPEGLEVPARGQVIHPNNGVHHVYDRIGSSYINVADFLEEAFRKGTSRHVSPHLPFRLLGPGSKQLFLHPRAYIENWQEYGDYFHQCPRERIDHRMPVVEEFCSRIWWNDLDPETVHPFNDNEDRAVVRDLSDGQYYFGCCRPDLVVPQYREAIFCWLPITRIEVIAGGKKTDENYAKAQASSLPVEIVEE